VFDGDVALLRRLLRAGIDPNAGDYDGRRAAHIAAAEGALAAVRGSVARPAPLATLHGAGHCRFCPPTYRMSAHLQALEPPVPAAPRSMTNSTPPSSALRCFSPPGRLSQLKVLVEEAGADLSVRDRWGATPLDEARRVGASAVGAYLEIRTGVVG
jgi:ankyrin repeat protein